MKTNLKDFCDILNEIDRNFNEEGTPLKQRKSLATNLIAERFNWKLNLSKCNYDTIAEEYVNKSNAVQHIINYFEYKYYNYMPPKKLLGSCLITIQNNPFIISLPGVDTIIFGTICFNINTNMSDDLNLLSFINNFPPNLSKYLSKNDAKNLIDDCKQNHSVFEQLNLLSSRSTIAKAALEDHRIAMNEICLEKPNQYGQAKWAILQFVEKIIKAIILLKSPSVKLKDYGHNLNKLNSSIEEMLNINTKRNLIYDIACNPRVRYGEEAISRSETIRSYKSAMKYLYDLMNNHFIKDLI